MAQGRRSQRRETIAAQVYLRSVSGRSVRELASGPLPDDLSPFRPTEAARTAVHRFLADFGFKVYSDELGLALSIEGPPSRFSRMFGIDAARITKAAAHETLSLRPPPQVSEFIEEIVVLPKPELFQG